MKAKKVIVLVVSIVCLISIIFVISRLRRPIDTLVYGCPYVKLTKDMVKESAELYFADTKKDAIIKIKKSSGESEYTYPIKFLPKQVVETIKKDIPDFENNSNDIFQIIDMNMLLTNNYLANENNIGLGCYDENGLFNEKLLDPAINPEKYDRIFIRHKKTGFVYYLEGIKNENGSIEY